MKMILQIMLISILSFATSCSDEPEKEDFFLGHWEIVSKPENFIYFYRINHLSFIVITI